MRKEVTDILINISLFSDHFPPPVKSHRLVPAYGTNNIKGEKDANWHLLIVRRRLVVDGSSRN